MDGNGDVRMPRETWGSKTEFVLSCLGIAELHSIIFVPYWCFNNGGGTFLVPYFIMQFFVRIPLLLMKLAVGQYTRNGPVEAMRMLAPGLQGIGFATIALQLTHTTVYSVSLAWALYYLVASFNSKLPYDSCDNSWNTRDCVSPGNSFVWSVNDTRSSVAPNSPTDEYFAHRVLQKTDGIYDFGKIRWEITGFLLLAWIFVYLCLHKGVKSFGKAVYLTAIFPYLVLVILVGVGASLEGARNGLSHFFITSWEGIQTFKVWRAALMFNIYCMYISSGSSITFSSYNDFHSRTLVRDTLLISGISTITDLLASCALFSIAGHFAFIINEDFDSAFSSSGFQYIWAKYPAFLTTMPVPQLWFVLYFIMVICVLLNTQFALVEVLITTLKDSFPRLKPLYCKHQHVLLLFICLFLFACGIPGTFQGGIYYLHLLYSGMTDVFILFVVLAEIVAICLIYGAGRLRRNIEEMTMTSSPPNILFVCCWYISPFFISVFFVVGIKTQLKWDSYLDPPWARYIAWFIALLQIIWIPIGFVYAFARAEGSISERLVLISTSPISELTYGYQFQEDSTSYRLTNFDQENQELIPMDLYQTSSV